MIDGNVEIYNRKIIGVHVALDTEFGFNVVRRNVLLYGWEDVVDITSCEKRVNDRNGNPLKFQEILWLTNLLGI